ncbi:hypothetical protein FB45DRAFT_878438 [Roridomyces roridus]|uniref:Uncharacterized protein n=1 Tax=Roridomyces roridus TaxID=1738132 RepID=A0AAD7B0T5_9AGAR|nr:hypothetical protein FB45DRAFT_878438 [Roridomyces roridus]
MTSSGSCVLHLGVASQLALLGPVSHACLGWCYHMIGIYNLCQVDFPVQQNLGTKPEKMHKLVYHYIELMPCICTIDTTLAIQFSDDPKSWAKTSEAIRDSVKAVFAGGPPTIDGIHTVLLLHALAPYTSFVDSLMVAPDLSPKYIEHRLATKAALPRASLQVTAFAAHHPAFPKKPTT